MNKKTISAGFIIIFLITILSGCLENISFDGSVTYETHPIKVQYTISYGYFVNFTGSGKHEVEYNCNIPEILQGTLFYDILYNSGYENVILANNSLIKWNISGIDDKDYKLGVEANVTAESFLVSDLNGEEALTLEEIQTLHPEVLDKYGNDQIDNGLAYLEANNDFIKSSAQSVLNQVNDNNSFLVAKGLFQWLKQYSDYESHQENNSVQPAIRTYQLRKGDCDDLSFLYISLCRSVSIPARFISGFLIYENEGVKSAIRHAWTEVFVGGNITDNGWIPVECAGNASIIKNEIHQNFGLEDVKHLRLFVDDGSNESLNLSISPPLQVYKYSPDIDVDIQEFIAINNYVVLESKELYVDREGNREYK